MTGDGSSVFDFLSTAEQADVSADTLTMDVSAGVQAAMDYASGMNGSGGFGVKAPRGSYRLDSQVELSGGTGNNVDLVGQMGDNGTYFVPTNSVAAFTSPGGSAKLRMRRIGFRAMGDAIGSAFALKGPVGSGAAYIQRCIFEEIDMSANMGGGFYGNFIMCKWLRGEWGWYGTPGAQFLPLFCKGDSAGNWANMNLMDGVGIEQSKGADTLYFEAGNGLALRNMIFENCGAARLINCAGISNVSIDTYYIEGCDSGGINPLMHFGDNPSHTVATNTISVRGGTVQLVPRNSFLIDLSGAAGGIEFTGNTVLGIGSGQHILSGASGGVDSDFSAYYNNSTPGLYIPPTPYPPQLGGSVSASNATPATLFNAATRGNGLYLVSVQVAGLNENYTAEALISYSGSGNAKVQQVASGNYMTILTSGTLVQAMFGGGGGPMTIGWQYKKVAN